ncbi:MAG TPA: DNA mismatch repair protein MutS [Thermoplasmata archaeon]|nr:DNA mismatch repair protein MutS [Thermoplasmata archaeon]
MSGAAASTPLLAQYEGVKARYPGHLVLFRVGDFYETFGDDAKLLSRELDVVLTARAPDVTGDRTPMAGVPHHAVETYLGRLVRKGYKVAICDQLEDARFAKGLVRRDVTRVVSPGTVVEDRILGGPEHSFLASLVEPANGPGGFAAVDITTGEWFHGLGDGPGVDGLLSAVAPFQPREILWSSGAPTARSSRLSRALAREFRSARLEAAPEPVVAEEVPAPLHAEVDLGAVVVEADRRLVAYLRVAQPRIVPHLILVDRGRGGRRLVLDAKTLRHLEVRRPMNPDDPDGATLLGTWDATVTAAGRRTLEFWLTNPLADVEAIRARQDAVEALIAHGARLAELRERLSHVGDLARIASRVAGRRVRPPELATLREGVRSLLALRGEPPTPGTSETLRALSEAIVPPADLVALLERSLPETLPPTEEAGELFRAGHAPEVDRWRSEERTALAALAELERSEQQATGIRTLKVGYNQVFGYYFEVSKPHLAKIPAHFRRRQTISQGERYTSDALDDLERKVREAREGARLAEASRWEEFLGEVDRHVSAVYRVARAVGELDALATFAHLAQTRGYVRPTVDASTALLIRDGRHPVLDRALGERFVPNDVELDATTHRLLVLTGPNMSGKSTYMRQVGLLVVLAQAGSYVPAKFARVGLVTQLFTRMGFTDEIGRGKSSFMVEMTEVAEILRAADDRSLVLLDEVGRGTSTFDGLAIAWATLRHLHDATRARSVLATHYHQLSDLVRGLTAAQTAHMAVREGSDGIVFLHRLVPGSTDQSYGIHVARLAGVPDGVLAEAERLLRQLESGGVAGTEPRRRAPRGPTYTQGILIADPRPPVDPLREELQQLDLDQMTPMDAHRRLAELKEKARSTPRSGEDTS